MPKKAKVDHQSTIKALLAKQGLFKDDGTIRGKKEQCWKDVSKSLNDKMTPNQLYAYFHQN
ncbi:hypothetical protein M0O54_20205, partial [Acinetobacter lactucae]